MGIKEKVLKEIGNVGGEDYLRRAIDLTLAEAKKENALEWRDFFKECGVMENIGVDRKKLIIDKLRLAGDKRK